MTATADAGSVFGFQDYYRSPRTIPTGAGSVTSSPRPTWFAGVEERCRRLTQLGPDWDSYGARPVSFSTAIAALEFLAAVVPRSLTSSPGVVPTASGGLQFEWHAGPEHLEIEFSAPGRVSFLFSDERTGTEQEENLTADVSLLVDLLKRVALQP